MGFRQIENDIKSGAADRPAPILLCGEERFLIDFYERKLESLFSAGGNDADSNRNASSDGSGNTGKGDSRGAGNSNTGKAVRELDVTVFYGNEEGDASIMGALDTFPMLSPVRIVIVKEHPGLSSPGQKADETQEENTRKKKKGLPEFLAQIPPTSRLIFTSGKVNKTRALYKSIAKHGTVYEFSRLDEADLQKFSRKRFKAFGTEISQDVLEAFIFATGYLEKDSENDLFTIENEAYKLSSFAISEGRTDISHKDLEECMPGILRTDVFAMLDAISLGKKAEAVQLLENSLAGGESAFRLLSLFTGHFEIMLGYRELSAEGHNAKEITKIMGERSDWRVKKLGGFAQRFDLENLKFILGQLYDMERQIKSGDIRERHALTVLLAEI